MNGLKQRLSCREVPIQRSRPHACLFRDIIQADICTRTGKFFSGDFEDALAIALRVSAGFSRGLL
jgi:hypothetical protein